MKTSLRLPAGCRVTLRPIGPADAGALEDFVQHRLGAASRRCRFHGAVNGCAPALLRQLTGADGAQHVAWAAWLQDGAAETLVGEARYVVEADGESAELAISVADAWQGRGIADLLLDALFESARRARVRWLYGIVLESNARMAAFMQRCGFVRSACAAGCDAGSRRLERAVAAPRYAPRRPVRQSRLGTWLLQRLFGIALPPALQS